MTAVPTAPTAPTERRLEMAETIALSAELGAELVDYGDPATTCSTTPSSPSAAKRSSGAACC